MNETAENLRQTLIAKLTQALSLEVRSAPPASQSLDAIVSSQQLKDCEKLLCEVLGPPVKPFNQAARFDRATGRAINAIGGIRKDQCLFLKAFGIDQAVYAALWPWASDSTRVTLKVGVLTLKQPQNTKQEESGKVAPRITNLSAAGLAWLRIFAGFGIATHGFSKIFGGHMDGFIQGVAQVGFPAPSLFAWAAALSESVGGLYMALGLATRVAAFFIFATMSVALFVHHRADPFGAKELAYLYWSVSGAVLLMGGGRFALERILRKRKD